MPEFADLPCFDLLEHLLTERGLDVFDPASERRIATVANHNADDIKDAIVHVAGALPDWRQRTAKARAKILRAWFNAIIERKEDLARLLTLEQGKPLAEAHAEIEYGAAFVEWYGEEAKRIYGDIIPTYDNGQRVVVIKQPVGVIAAITPWNFPVAMITRKIAPALAAGCTAVMKPAETTPLCALALMKLAHDAGVPEAVFQTVTSLDPRMVGQIFCADTTVRKLSFTGSTEVGKILMKQSAQTMKRLSMELGGNAPFIVFDDADLDLAVAGAIAAKFRNAGQTCVSANRLMVQDGIYDAFVARFHMAIMALKVGPGGEEGVQIGPLIDARALEKVRDFVTDAVALGGRLIGGGELDGAGHFYLPGIIADATTDMRIAQEEIFGPIAPIFRFKTEKEAISIANETDVGLAAYFYTRDISRSWRVAEALEHGMVGINSSSVSTEIAPFGGVKESGNGREGSKYGIDEYIEIKALHFGAIG